MDFSHRLPYSEAASSSGQPVPTTTRAAGAARTGAPGAEESNQWTTCFSTPRESRGGCAASPSTAARRYFVRLAARIGWEAVWIEMEHGPAGFERVEGMCTAAEAGGHRPAGAPAGRRAQQRCCAPWSRGPAAVVVPMVDDAGHARRVVEYGKYAPVGARGYNTGTPGHGVRARGPCEEGDGAGKRAHLPV